MRQYKRVALVFAALLLPFASAAAQLRLSGSGVLDPVQIPFTAFTAGAVNYSFVVPQPPRGEAFPPDAFLLEGIDGRFTQGERTVVVFGDLLFYTADAGGGFVFGPTTGMAIINASGAQLFTRSVSAPFFRTGTFAVADFDGDPGVISVRGNVTLGAIAQVPEPSSILLLAGGLMSLIAVATVRQPSA